MTTFRPDTSFPFLKIAREHGVPYERVLKIADQLDGLQPWRGRRATPLSIAVADAIGDENRRRATVTYRARHTGDAP
jgi:hypothetical protein